MPRTIIVNGIWAFSTEPEHPSDMYHDISYSNNPVSASGLEPLTSQFQIG